MTAARNVVMFGFMYLNGASMRITTMLGVHNSTEHKRLCASVYLKCPWSYLSPYNW